MVTPVDSKPHVNDFAQTFTDDQGSVSGNVLVGATDPDGDTIVVAGLDGQRVGGPKGSTVFDGVYGTLTIYPDGDYTYVAHDGLGLKVTDVVSEQFQFKVSDGHGGFDVGFLKFTIDGTTNNRPVAVDDMNTTTGGVASGNVLSNDSDQDHDILRVSFVDDSSGHHYIAEGGSYTAHGVYGDLTINADGSYTYTAGGAAYTALTGDATDSFNYKIYDHTKNEEESSSNQGKLTIDVHH